MDKPISLCLRGRIIKGEKMADHFRGEVVIHVQPNFNGSNTFGTMKKCSRQGQLELMNVNHSARSAGIIGIFSISFT